MNPYWLEDPVPPRPEKRLRGRVDVAIVGAGVTGCSAALHLAEAGLRVRVHDARALERMAELAGDALRRPGSYRLADDEEREGIRLEYGALREDGFEAEWLDDVPGVAAGRFLGAISHPGDAVIQPARFVRRLAALAAVAGAELREHDPVEDTEALDAERVLVSTDGYGHGLVPELAELIWPTRGQVIASEPLDRVLYDRPHYARQGFTTGSSCRTAGSSSAASATSRSSTSSRTSRRQGRRSSPLESFLHELAGRDARVTNRWAGNVLGFACGRLAADALLGHESPQLELLDPARFVVV